MTKLGRSTMIRYLLLGTLALASNSWAQERAPILEQIAKTYGLDSYGQIEASATRGTEKFPDSSKLPTNGSGSPRPVRFRTKARIKTASRSR